VDDSESLLTFPCRFPIKVMGKDADEFQAHVIQLISAHVGPIPADDISVRASSNGNFLSVTITVNARSRAELDELYRTITASSKVLFAV
jgi:putative lipoic acid-binding regulatory protein